MTAISTDHTVLADISLDHLETLKKLQLVTDNIKDVIWMTDINKNTIVFISKGYERVWERTCESLYEDARSFVEAIHPEDRQNVIEALKKQAAGNYNEIYRIQTPSGTKWIQDRGFPIHDDKGRAYLIVGIASDITEQKTSQELIEQERARSIQSSKLATLGEMAGGIAHEINNPLAAISAKFQQMKKLIEEQETIKATQLSGSIELIQRNISRIEKIVKSLRLVSRDGHLDPCERVKLTHVLEDTLELCLERFRHHNVCIKLDIQAKPIVNGRPVQISQVILNLLSNAFDAVMHNEERWVEVGMYERNTFAEIVFTDNGHGIPKNLYDKIM